MKLEEMILVVENWKGTETIFLLGLSDYMEMVLRACGESAICVADAVRQLYDSKKDGKQCSEIYFAGNKSSQAKFCKDVAQLRGFLLGMQEEGIMEPPTFDESRCTPECLEVLKAYGVGTDGHDLFNSLHYEPIEHGFKAGETVRNLNGSDYKVLEVLSPKNLLLMAVSTGEILVGVNTQYYQRTPKEGYSSSDSVICGIEWGSGVYLGKRVTNVIFEKLRSSYGVSEEQETLAQFRDRKEYEFRLYQSLMDCTSVSHMVRTASRKSLDDVFGTEDYETFLAFLEKGYYDGDFRGTEKKEQQMEYEKSR